MGLILVEVESVLSHLRHYAQHYPTEGRCEVGSPTQRSGPRSEGSFPALVSRARVQQQSNKRYQEDRSVSPDTQQGKKQRAHVAPARSGHCHWKISTQEHEQIGTSNNVCNQDKVF